MENKLFSYSEQDVHVVELYKEFLPQKVFDAHTHMYCAEDLPGLACPGSIFGRQRGTYSDYMEDMGFFLPGVEEVRLNMLPMPHVQMFDQTNGRRDHANAFIADQLDDFPGNVGAPYVFPCDSEEDIGNMLAHPGMRAMKVYCFGATPRADYNTCLPAEFVPEAAWSVSAQTQIPIVLHMMKPHALSDEDNLQYITQMARRYPDARLILAHCARAFSAWTVLKSIDKLAGLDNIWFDMAAICEPTPIAACILHTAGERVMWGSDYPICMHKGKAFSLNHGFYWMTEKPLEALGMDSGYFAGENLLAFYLSAKLLDLDQTQIDRIFYKNAMDLFGLT